MGGLLVGLLEGAYRDVPLVYAALFYGALWALAGAAGGLVIAMAFARRPEDSGFTSLGAMTAVGLSTLALGRFIIFRDLFAEAPGRGALAWGLALGAAAFVTVGCGLLAWMGRRWLAVAPRARTSLLALPAAVLIAFAVHTQVGDDPAPLSPPARPLHGKGVILLVADTLRADALGAYGALPHRGAPASPTIDAFAQRGRLFKDVSAQASWTRPAMATLLTSRHVSGHQTMSKTAVLPETLPTIASELKSHGISTAAVVTNYNLEAVFGFARAFDHFRYLPPARYLGAPASANRLAAYNAYRLMRESLLVAWHEPRYFYRSAQDVNAAAFSTLDAIGDGDFFLWLHYMEPHDPYFSTDGRSFARVATPHPPKEWAPAMRLAYQDGVRRFDDGLKELLDGLAARGLTDQVTLVLVSDHGEEFAEHGGFYHGTTLYEEQLQVPLIVAGPGVVPGVQDTLARQIDVAPTILSRYGIKSPPSFEGRDLFDSGSAPPTVTCAEEDHEGNILQALREGDSKLIVANPDNPRGLRPLELYNLSRDPKEQRPEANPNQATRLSAALAAHLEAAKKGGAHAQHRAVDKEAEAELRSLGYVQ